MRTGLAFAVVAFAACGANAQQAAEPDPLQTRVLDEYAMLEGKWELDPESLPEEQSKARAEQGIERSGVSFAFGTDRQWMEFHDWRQQAGELRATGIGLVAFSPREQQVIFTEHGARGAAVHGTIAKRGEREFVRDISVSRTDTAWRQQDVWVFDADGRCFSWTSQFKRNGAGNASPPVRYCREK